MKISYFIKTDKVGSTCEDSFEVDDSDFEGMTLEERNEALEGLAKDAAFNHIEWNWEAVEEQA